jgi:hypothetical protein
MIDGRCVPAAQMMSLEFRQNFRKLRFQMIDDIKHLRGPEKRYPASGGRSLLPPRRESRASRPASMTPSKVMDLVQLWRLPES